MMVALVLLLLALLTMGAWAQGGSRVSGVAFHDVDGNLQFSEGDVPLPGSMVTIGGNQVFAGSSPTNAEGRYEFEGVPSGRYHIVASSPKGFTPAGEGGARNIQVQPGAPARVDFPFKPDTCVKIEVKRIIWLTDGSGCFDMTFTLTNNAPYPIGHIYSINPLPVYIKSPLTASNNYIPVSPPLPPGQSRTFTVRVCGVPPNSTFVWQLNVHDPEMKECCPGYVEIKVPPCDCFQILEEEIICLPDGSYQWCFTIQSLYQGTVNYFLVQPPSNTIAVNPVVNFFNPPIQYGQSQQFCITITGATPGGTLSFPITFVDRKGPCCTRVIDVTFPGCGCVELPGECFARKPDYQDKEYLGFPGTVGAITCWADPTLDPDGPGPMPVFGFDAPVLSLQNLNNYQTTAVPLNVDWVPTAQPRGYHGPVSGSAPMGLWNLRNLGSIFGLTIDKYGNIFVTHTSCYWQDFIPSGSGPGMIYMIQNGTGAIFRYLQLPNSNPNPSNPDTWPGLGNISYDGNNDQLFVTNMEDGKIYRVAGTGGFATSQGSWINTFDPNNPIDGWSTDPGTSGMVNLDDRLWGVQYHQGRVYFGRWRVDPNFPDNTKKNEIWSVGIQANGDFDGVYGRELEVPYYGTGNAWSMPVSDISFGPQGQMMIAERGVGGFGNSPSYPNWTDPWRPHEARGLEYVCRDDKWQPSGRIYEIGLGNTSSSGGTDYDYDTSSITGNPNSGPRVWFTMNAAFNSAGAWYGIQGIKFTTGGTQAQSIIQDADGLQGTYSKTWIGDVEIPCPRGADGTINGRVQLRGLSISPGNRVIGIQVIEESTGVVFSEKTAILDELGNYQVQMPLPSGAFHVKIDAKCYLRRNAVSTAGGYSAELLPGDIDGDNEVTVMDYIVLSQSFDLTSEDPAWLVPGPLGFPPAEADIDGDGAITVFDYILLSEHFGLLGD